MQPFIPSAFNLPVAWAVDFSLPILLKQLQNLDGVVLKPQDVKMLRSIRDDRLLYFSNHPTTSEPPVAYYVANVMGARFQFMAARQVFEWGGGLVGKFISSIGAFSVLAGAADRESIKMSRAILSQPRGKLVLYPEGEPTSGENDNLLPFQQGAAQLGIWALEDARKSDPSADVTVLPTFVKYVMTGTEAHLRADLHQNIKIVEAKLGVDPGNRNLLRRFLAVGRVMLEKAEKDYGVPMASEKDYDYRVGRVRHVILDNVAERLGLTSYDKKSDAIVKLRHLLAVIEMILVKFPDPRLPNPTASDIEWAQRECQKAYDFIVIKPEYLLSRPSAERFYEWLARFETTIDGSTNPRPRKAHVFFAKPFLLSEYYADYKKEKKVTVEKLTARLRADTQALLDQAVNLTEPLVRPYDIGAPEKPGP
ncbi:MAG TPA: 1-acyl-sn-glycerol-3-phosphate acyltransferase [Leptospiraceae bacterium]|nr:1-acyl-sn-glycerol-3-phosphate acyltransferase [Leptospiraceae bacterium]HMY45633.1 1-acyl-sn-glycerol-3-phosphate acyltransferase [Leptospiraceae bacterium]HMZ37377.1 1-acyl-sn-glycerol-3-phosphate acyltransferase [Leptospiraceae bacterium]HNE24648.1 1-acyl-sn-glycerol-3-phosphate acyltransferase [Leptospiraceae bacterium]HNJ32668.1 1-acyl-sn-glycerol-3-phosphate acyltransferase [Leptospiraceae bacterium]